jgi:hypothetical protein
MARPGLVALQVLGALSLLAFPFVAIICIVAAPKANVPGAIPYFLVLLYPAVWISLWIRSWFVVRRGAISKAYFLSAIPVVLSVLLAAVFYFLRPGPR